MTRLNDPEHWLLSRPIAHRGLYDERYPENSMPAFECAASAGYPVEMDVHADADGKLVIMHDYDTERMTGKSCRISRTGTEELMKLKLKGTEWGMPGLDEVLDMISGRVPVLIEIKNEGLPGMLEKKLSRILGSYKGEVAVESFDPLSLIYMRQRDRGLLLGQLSYLFSDKKMPAAVKAVLRDCRLDAVVSPDFIAYDISALPRRAIDRERKRGMPVIGWTAGSAAEAEFAERECDNYIFEHIRP